MIHFGTTTDLARRKIVRNVRLIASGPESYDIQLVELFGRLMSAGNDAFDVMAVLKIAAIKGPSSVVQL